MTVPRVLLVQLPNPVGDVVMTTPLLQVLRESLPETRIVVAGKAMFGELLAGLDTFDEFLPAPPRRGGWSGAKLQADGLREANANCAIILPNSWSSALAARMAGIRRRIGRRAHGRSLLLSDALPKVGGARAMTRIYLEMLAPLGIAVPFEDEAPTARLVVDSASIIDATAILGTKGKAESANRPDGFVTPRFLGVAPGAAFGESKIYPLEMLAEAVAIVQQQCDLDVILLGSPAEMDLLEAAASEMTKRNVAVQIPPPGGFAAAKFWISQCSSLLTMDSGARHIAAALQIPQTVLYGPTHPGWSAHSLELTQIMRREEVDCLGCHHKQCPIDHRCMRRMEPTAVASAILKQVER